VHLWDLSTGTSLAKFMRLEPEQLPVQEDFSGGASRTRFWSRQKVHDVVFERVTAD
jgi:hypothetical protein